MGMKKLFKTLLVPLREAIAIAQQYKNKSGDTRVQAFFDANGFNDEEQAVIRAQLV